ncbi:hypothetical protein Dip510_001511 [Elusimicrobium posterum]|uniref:hypothetical protein n=1 Tax=Elusimicrobium posterum TaxID=3116653 RepID=UPI003C7941C8
MKKTLKNTFYKTCHKFALYVKRIGFLGRHKNKCQICNFENGKPLEIQKSKNKASFVKTQKKQNHVQFCENAKFEFQGIQVPPKSKFAIRHFLCKIKKI